MATDLKALADDVQKLSPAEGFRVAAKLCALGRFDHAEVVGRNAVEKLAGKRLGLVK